MPKASKETASHVEDMGVMEGRYEELGGLHRRLRDLPRGRRRDAAVQGPAGRPLPEPALGLRRPGQRHLPLRGPRRGLRGRRRLLRAPGPHPRRSPPGTEIVEFSPTEEYGRTMEVLERNLAAMAES